MLSELFKNKQSLLIVKADTEIYTITETDRDSNTELFTLASGIYEGDQKFFIIYNPSIGRFKKIYVINDYDEVDVGLKFRKDTILQVNKPVISISTKEPVMVKTFYKIEPKTPNIMPIGKMYNKDNDDFTPIDYLFNKIILPFISNFDDEENEENEDDFNDIGMKSYPPNLKIDIVPDETEHLVRQAMKEKTGQHLPAELWDKIKSFTGGKSKNKKKRAIKRKKTLKRKH